MFKYILLCSLLVHSIWAKPVEQQQNAIEDITSSSSSSSSIHGVHVVPHAVSSPIVQQPTYVRLVQPHEQSVVYVPVSGIHHHEGIARSSVAGIRGKQIYAEELIVPDSSFPDFGTYALEKLQIEQQHKQIQQQQLLLIQQQQKIQQLEQQLQKQPLKQTPLFSVETPLISAGVSSSLLNTVSDTVGSVANFLPNLLKAKSLPVYGHEQVRHYVVDKPYQSVVDYVPGSIVLSPVPISGGTVKTRRSIEAVEGINQTEEEKVIPIVAVPISEPLSSAQQIASLDDRTEQEKQSSEATFDIDVSQYAS